ncbi:hypothetical protein HME9302_02180 [Alteripontixanthobacter maritimus]|uniref:Uncharacterized protein n=1 Tax=Alteripontixanthobacter maritimus TaxID=2161824 RepID=A0A369Q7V2_9SPHN|nr:hypothetical protein [Alteripontixanthobacter maritimus]RDC60963.1 hypothetical protein HME9302_02180 [Alteripontixanthobacter maritimus]
MAWVKPQAASQHTARTAVGDSQRAHAHALDWRRRMSDHVAYALLVYTGLQIFMTTAALKDGAPGILPYLVLVVLVAAIIPACRWFERRWRFLTDEAAHDPALRGEFMRDAAGLWLMAIGLPAILTALFRAIL